MRKLVGRILNAGEGRRMRVYEQRVGHINAAEAQLAGLTDAQLTALAGELRERASSGVELDDLLVESFALTREASRRTIGLRHHDVQLIGAMALHDGAIAEMRTGEGKTLTATLAVALNALAGGGVHVVTVNDYLALRDAQTMGGVYEMLGLSVGALQNGQDSALKRELYRRDVVYATNFEIGFDYLRDNLALNAYEQVQRGRAFAIVDEVDSVLIDEARTPLIISGAPEDDGDIYERVDAFVRGLTGAPMQRTSRRGLRHVDDTVEFEFDERDHLAALTERGVQRAEQHFGLPHLYTGEHGALANMIMQALRAHSVYERDRDYVVIGDCVQIVDEHTGRVMDDRRWNDGLHQAVEAKERVPVTAEMRTIAQITYQRLFRGYGKLAGMTGTALTEAAEFKKTYGLDIVVVPTHRPDIRVDRPDLIYATKSHKWDAVAAEVSRRHRTGQPVLVGTVSVEDSELLSQRLSAAGVDHQVLNAKPERVAQEAAVIAGAGRLGAVTVATNMAGRGVDIMLGGDARVRAARTLTDAGLTPRSEQWQAAWPQALHDSEQTCERDAEQVRELGGLFVLGTERHQSRRIDNQLRGRSGRQGDPGETQFMVSAEDELMRLYGSDRLFGIVEQVNRLSGAHEGEAVQSAALSRQAEKAQRHVEDLLYLERKQTLEFDEVLDAQREVVYDYRQEILDGADLAGRADAAAEDVICRLGSVYLPEGDEDAWNGEGLADWLRQVGAQCSLPAGSDRRAMLDYAQRALLDRYHKRAAELGPELQAAIARGVLLTRLDRCWQQQLSDLAYLRHAIGLRGHAQEDPVIAYKSEALVLFGQMMDEVWHDFFGVLLTATVKAHDADGNEVAVESVAAGLS